MTLFFSLFFLWSFVSSSTSSYLPEFRPAGLPTYTPSNTSDFGVDTFQSWIQLQISSNYLEVAVAQGIYTVSPQSGSSSSFTFQFHNIVGITIWMDAVTLIFTDYTKGGFVFNNCSQVTLRGLTTRYSVPTFSQAKVINITISGGNSLIDVESCSGYPNKFLYETTAKTGGKYVYIFNGKTRQPYQPNKRTQIYPLEVQSLSNDNNTLRWTLDSGLVTGGNIAVGDYVITRGYGTNFHEFYFSWNISYIDVTLMDCGGFGYYIFGGKGGHTMNRIKITYAPPPFLGAEPPLVTCSADGFHVVANDQGPVFINSLFEGLQDDGINLQGVPANVTGVLGNGKFNLYFIGQEYVPRYEVGDKLRVYDNMYNTIGTAVILDVSLPTSDPPGYYGNPTVTLEGDAVSSIKIGCIVTNTNHQNDGFLISNSTFRWKNSRALLIKASNGIIENNIINVTAFGGINMMPELGTYAESDYPVNVTIRNNWISHASFQNGFGSIAVFAGVGGNVYAGNYDQIEYVPKSGGAMNLTISNNVILGSPRDNIRVFSTTGVSIINNIISGPLSFGFPGINLTNVDNAIVLDNCVGNKQNATSPLISLNHANGTSLYPSPENGVQFCTFPVPSLPLSPFDPLLLESGKNVVLRSGFSGMYAIVYASNVTASVSLITQASVFQLQSVPGGFAFYFAANKCYLSVDPTTNEVTCANLQIPFIVTPYPGQYVIITYVKNNNLLTFQPANNKIYASTNSQIAQVPYVSLFYLMCPDGTNSCGNSPITQSNKIFII